MGKPFRLEGEVPQNAPPSPAGIGRMPNGKFTRIESPDPHDMAKEAEATGAYVSEVVQARRVPDRGVGSGMSPNAATTKDAVHADAIPWPDASGPNNDTRTSPMRVKR